MAAPAGSLGRTDLGSGITDNVKEDVSDVIYNVSPTETPWYSNVATTDASQDRHEWQIDDLAPARSDNAHVDGDNFTAEGEAQAGDGFDGVAINGTTRIGNWCVIPRKDISITRRTDIVAKHGRRSEVTMQIAKAAREMKRDCEAAAMAINFGVQTSKTVAGRTAGVPTWLTTSTFSAAAEAEGIATGHNDGVLTNGTPAAPADGFDADTPGAMTETLLTTCIGSIYNAGGDPDVLMMHPDAKQQFSKYMFSSNARIATPYQDHGKKPSKGITVIGSVDIYVSDFGELYVTPNRFQRSKDIFILEMEMWAVAYLDGHHITSMGVVGDSKQRVLLADWAVVSRNEAASGAIFDVAPTTAWTA